MVVDEATRIKNDAMIHRVCLTIMEGLQAEYDRRASAYFAEHGENQRQPCASCAIQKYGNKARGMEKTTLGLFSAIATGQPFYCHHGAPHIRGEGWQVDPKTAPFCAAWWIVCEGDRPLVMRLLEEALTKEYGAVRPVDDEALDLLTGTLMGMLA